MAINNPTISFINESDNYYSVTVQVLGENNKLYYVKLYDQATGNIVWEETYYENIDNSTSYDHFVGFASDPITLIVEVQSYNDSEGTSIEYSETVTETFTPLFNPCVGKPVDFTCTLREGNPNWLDYSFKVPEGRFSSGYKIEITVNDSLNVDGVEWEHLTTLPDIVDATTEDRTVTGTLWVETMVEEDKYLFIKVTLLRDDTNFYPGYSYLNLPKHSPYKTHVVKDGESKPCITRVYRDNQWRQCDLQYYMLHPLISAPLIDEPIDEIIKTIDKKPVFVSEKCDSSLYQLFSMDNYELKALADDNISFLTLFTGG